MSDSNGARKSNIPLGILAGIAGGLAAAWVMNEFMAGPAVKLKRAVQSDDQNFKDQIAAVEASAHPQPDATMKAADAIVEAATGGRHLSWEQQQKAGPIVHYAFGALMGGIYGGLAEVSPLATAGFGSTFGGVLFGGADLVAVPALRLSPSENNHITPALISPFAAHLVYGVTTEFVRRLIRSLL